jgi:hypothetical protein
MTDTQTKIFGPNNAAAASRRDRLTDCDADGLRYAAPFRLRRRPVTFHQQPQDDGVRSN